MIYGNLALMKSETINDIVKALGAELMAKTGDSAPFICAISGAQGAGKSTLCERLAAYFEARHLTCITLALDDFYLPRQELEKLAHDIHPLCATRGVPGTHDVRALNAVLNACQATGFAPFDLMRFDKSTDEQCPKETWPRIKTRPDIILLEGWCVGATPDMVSPAAETDWEKTHDPEAIWKGWSRDAANRYAPIWAACHVLIQLAQSDFEAVIDARWLQEKGNAAASGIWQFQSRSEVAAFCAHYESWTKALWRALPARADKLITRHAGFTYAVTK